MGNGWRKDKLVVGKFASNSSVFAKRGDPWVSEREGQTQFGRNLDSEDPAFDQFFATRAQARPVYKDPPPLKAKAIVAEPLVKRTNELLKAKRGLLDDDNPFKMGRKK